jgi:hypothetical protein
MQPITKLTIEDTHVPLHSFQFYAVCHISMEANGVAHRMVKTALIQSLNQTWIEECPSFILSIVLVEQEDSF